MWNNSCIVNEMALHSSTKALCSTMYISTNTVCNQPQDVASSISSYSLLHVYLLGALETDPALGGPQAAGGAG